MEYNYKTKAGTRYDPILFACRSKKNIVILFNRTHEARVSGK